jgi:Kef-type K+ transport system membrane component KefB
MFLSGYNTNIQIDKKNMKTIMLVFIGATIIPMLGAIPFIGLFKDYFIGTINNNASFSLVFCIGVAITSIPVISKIFFDMGIMNTKFSNTILTVSTFQDLCLWILLNMATRIATTGNIKISEMIMVVLITLGLFVLITFFTKYVKEINKKISTRTIYLISFILLLLICGFLSKLGINIMYSAFLVGYMIKGVFGTKNDMKKNMEYFEHFVFSFFVPIYFGLVGIQLNVIHDFSLLRFTLFFVVAFGLEFIGTWGLLLFSKLSRDMRMNFAITMNARGGPGIVLATVSYASNIINIEFFTVLILTTMLSSMIAGYYLRHQQKKDSRIFNML